MNKVKIKVDYKKYAKFYQQLQLEVFKLLNKLKKEYKNIDVAEIRQRPQNKIKKIESIYANIDNPKKYVGYTSIFNITDIAGNRVICHCEDDVELFTEIIKNVLDKKGYIDVSSEKKGGPKRSTRDQKSRPSYWAIHVTLAQKYKYKRTKIKIYCEIQLRTIMSDAWAVQDRKYIYGQPKTDGVRHILTDSVSEIMQGCEGLWSLVKQKYKEDLDKKNNIKMNMMKKKSKA